MIIHAVPKWGVIAPLAALALLSSLPGSLISGETRDTSSASAQTTLIAPKDLSKEQSLSNGFPIRLVSPGVFELGDVKMSMTERSVRFPARLNAASLDTNQIPMEYLLVTRYGKTHESILVTETDPYLIHVAMLLLDTTSAGTNNVTSPPSSQISKPAAATMLGDKITLEVSWQAEGREKTIPAERLAFNTITKTNLDSGAWVYNGSVVWDKHFLAQRDGSVVSLVTDPIALMNNTGPGHDDDHIWKANTDSLPPIDAPLQIIIKLETKLILPLRKPS